jgi:hypothetical protein
MTLAAERLQSASLYCGSILGFSRVQASLTLRGADPCLLAFSPSPCGSGTVPHEGHTAQTDPRKLLHFLMGRLFSHTGEQDTGGTRPVVG